MGTENKRDALKILFVCVGNSCRSQMAEAYANKLSAGRARAWSAGSHPLGEIVPETAAVQRLTTRGFNVRAVQRPGEAKAGWGLWRRGPAETQRGPGGTPPARLGRAPRRGPPHASRAHPVARRTGASA